MLFIIIRIIFPPFSKSPMYRSIDCTVVDIFLRLRHTTRERCSRSRAEYIVFFDNDKNCGKEKQTKKDAMVCRAHFVRDLRTIVRKI